MLNERWNLHFHFLCTFLILCNFHFLCIFTFFALPTFVGLFTSCKFSISLTQEATVAAREEIKTQTLREMALKSEVIVRVSKCDYDHNHRQDHHNQDLFHDTLFSA